jgi:hypothetical protein
MEDPTAEKLHPLAEQILIYCSELLGVDLGDFDEDSFYDECHKIATMIEEEFI